MASPGPNARTGQSRDHEGQALLGSQASARQSLTARRSRAVDRSRERHGWSIGVRVRPHRAPRGASLPVGRSVFESGRPETGGYPLTVSDMGTGQGSVISPLLANVYLHYVFDLWAERWRRREATGEMIILRYADDIIVGFEHETDARRFQDAMRARLEEFALSLHPAKTRLIEFGRFAAVTRSRRGSGKPETF